MFQVDTHLWRGPRPKNILDLKSLGIERIVSLESGIYELLHDDKYELQFPNDFGIQHFHVGLGSVLPPDNEHVWAALDHMKAPLKTYVHCLQGVDRTGFICAVYRMRIQHYRYQAALKEWKELGRHLWYATWEPFLKEWE